MQCNSQLVAASCVIALLMSTAQAGLQPGGKIIELDEDNWHLMLKGEWMIEFFAPWCPACKNLGPTWERFARVAKDVKVEVAKMDVTSSKKSRKTRRRTMKPMMMVSRRRPTKK
ncbi:thioredoxin-related transmembrane protein 1-like [Drosophila pseudoobscura]|uniref:Thioredoxin-related transmembrane protein 1-like n=1 Tax=Drosophila pseudoobscura pseudoobscura TaxID=46245 RepID=A0A6I8VYM7_DROPS|nr:thioredoxin-related transmembrane protein 1-like [Drosophila pseudoobscura]